MNPFTSQSPVKNVSASNRSTNASSESFTNNGVFIAASAGLSIVVPITVVLIVQFWRAKKLERAGNRQAPHSTNPNRSPDDLPPSYEQVFGPVYDIPVAVPPSYSSIQYLIQHEESLPRRENATHANDNRLVHIFRDQTPPAVGAADNSCCHDNLTGSQCPPVSIPDLNSNQLDSVSVMRIAVHPSNSPIFSDNSMDRSFSTQKDDSESLSETSAVESKVDLIMSTHFSSPPLAPLTTSATQMPPPMTASTQRPSQMTASTQMPSQSIQEPSTHLLAPIQLLSDPPDRRETSTSSVVHPLVTPSHPGPAPPSAHPPIPSNNTVEAPPPSYDDVLKIMDLAISSSSQHKVTK